jgi:hypothetical protein
MNWEAVSAISELVGSGAILVTLIYLALQIRQNTASVQASTRQALLQEDQLFISRGMDDPELILLRFKPDLSDEEKVRVNTYLITFFRIRESNWLQYRSGVLDEATWASYRGALTAFASARVRAWLDSDLIAPMFDPEFLSMVKEFLAGCPDRDRPVWLDTFT